MVRSVVARQQSTNSRTKVKTGCATCRIRKIKCDESKPFCQRCARTGRTCDGYESPFRNITGKSRDDIQVVHIRSDSGLLLIQPTSLEVTSQEVDLLNRYLSIKTIFDVKLDCNGEARQVLQASLTDPSIQHAVSSLRALRENFQVSRSGLESVTQHTLSYNYGLHQYNMALKGLASNLSSPSSNGLKSALLCCHIFISIEQVQANYAAMARHIIQGLNIMRAYRIRPELSDANELLPARHSQLPLLDIYIIKLFATPCKFAEPPSEAEANRTTSSASSISSSEQSIISRNNRMIVPDMRTELTRIAASTIDFLNKVAQAESAEYALRLLSEKMVLSDSLNVWFTNLELVWTEVGRVDTEPVSVSFMRLFHVILEIIILEALKSSTNLDNRLQTKNDRLQGIADGLSERLRGYSAHVRNSRDLREQSTAY